MSYASEKDASEFLLRGYAICMLILYLLYFVTQMTAVDAKAHPPEDAKLMAKKLEELATLDEAGQELVRKKFQLIHSTPLHLVFLGL